MDPIVFESKVHWLKKEEGGRSSLPQGHTYAATARFKGEAEYFSVVLTWDPIPLSQNGQPTQIVKLRLLFPELLPALSPKMTAGSHLEITEGPRKVADCEILGRTASVEPTNVSQGRT